MRLARPFARVGPPAAVRYRNMIDGVVTAILLTALPVTAGATGSADLPWLRVAIPFDTSTTEPGNVMRLTTTDDLTMQITESLVAMRNDGSVAPMLADSWTTSPDGKSYTFKLRHGITFHNGDPMTSADVKWSIEHMVDPKAALMCRGAYDGTLGSKVVSIETPGPDTVVVGLDRPNALFLTQMTNTLCPLAILSPKSVDANGSWVKPIGTGPFMLGTWQRGQYIDLPAFEHYRSRSEASDGEAGAKRAYVNLKYVIIPDAASQKVALASGQIDIAPSAFDQLPPPDPRWKIVTGASFTTTAVLIQTKDSLLSDVRMRRAIAHSIDFEILAKALTKSQATYNPSLVPQTSRFYGDEHRTGYKQDLTEVRKLLAEVGYHGQPITLQTTQRYPALFREAVIVQQFLRTAGINVQLEPLEWGTLEANLRSGKFQLMTFSYTPRNEPALMYADVIGDKTRRPQSQWDDPQAMELLNSIHSVTDISQRQKVFDQLQQRMITDVPLLAVYNVPQLMIVSSKVSGFSQWSLTRQRIFNVKKDQ